MISLHAPRYHDPQESWGGEGKSCRAAVSPLGGREGRRKRGRSYLFVVFKICREFFWFVFIFVFVFFETGFLCEALAVLELIL